MDFIAELVHKIKCSLKCNVYWAIVFIGSLSANLCIYKGVIFIKNAEIDALEF